MTDPILTLGPSTAGLQPLGPRFGIGHGFATAGLLPGVGPVWVRVNAGWVGDGPGGPTRLGPAKFQQFVADCGQLSGKFNGHPTILPLIRWGGTRPHSRPHLIYQTPPGRSLAAVLDDGARLRAPHAAGLVALVAQAWLDLRSRGVPAPTGLRSVWLAADSPRVGLVDWLQPPDPEGTTVLHPGEVADMAMLGRGMLPGREAFGWSVASLLWFCLGGARPSLEDGMGAAMVGDWLQPGQLPEFDPEVAVIMQTAIGDDPPEPAALLRDLAVIAGRSGPPASWPTALVPSP